MPLRPGVLGVIEILKSAPTGDHGDTLHPVPISADYVVDGSAV